MKDSQNPHLKLTIDPVFFSVYIGTKDLSQKDTPVPITDCMIKTAECFKA